ncbi:FAD-binding protein [Novosphingobium rhizovicinum]|uniref:FAD-binding protein n=1 Tax=Novosphingobium rhizovicinum TaxID=3228928 RepID=A0ABV3REE8_9SPHN
METAGADEAFDFVIVGSGGGSMCAAIAARSMGLTALILEKTPLVGGTTAKSGGIMWVPNNRFMKRDGIEDSTEKAMTYLDHVVGDHNDTPGASRERRLAYVTRAPRMVDFLVEQGLQLNRHPCWPDYYDDLPGGIPEGRTVYAELFDTAELGEARKLLRPNFVPVPVKPREMWDLPLYKTTGAGKRAMAKVALRMAAAKLTGRKWANNGAALQGRMFKRALELGVEVRVNAGVERLMADSRGRISGVVVNIDGTAKTIAARSGVLINAGGFAHNQRMRDRYQPGTSAEWTATCEGDTGEMIEEMMRHGAAIAQMEEMVGNQAALPPGNQGVALVVTELTKPHAIVVDASGQRYTNEAQSYMSFCQAMLARDHEVPAVPSWMIFDSRFMSKYIVAGSLPGTKKPAAWYDEGFLVKADSLAALAQACGVPPATLEATVARFNGFACEGIDRDFNRGGRAYDRFVGDKAHKPSPTLGTLEQGPFYAYRLYPGDVGTYGGVVTDCEARVLREDGSAIPGLYATGTSTASVMGRAYPGAGASVGPSFVWGYVAALHAARASSENTAAHAA